MLLDHIYNMIYRISYIQYHKNNIRTGMINGIINDTNTANMIYRISYIQYMMHNIRTGVMNSNKPGY